VSTSAELVFMTDLVREERAEGGFEDSLEDEKGEVRLVA
jgi:hypothetical protein